MNFSFWQKWLVVVSLYHVVFGLDVDETVQAVKIMQPKLVIPCHYNYSAFFTRSYNPADDKKFKATVEKAGARCVIMGIGESVDLENE